MTEPTYSWSEDPYPTSLPLPRRRGFARPHVWLALAAAGTGLALTATAGYAFWSGTGTGSSAAQASTMVTPVVSAGTVSGTQLYPGLTANGTSTGGTLSVTATNPNPFPVTITVTLGTGAVTGCTTPAISLVSTSFAVPANQTSAVPRVLSNVVSMGTGASNDCQGQTLTIPVATSATS